MTSYTIRNRLAVALLLALTGVGLEPWLPALQAAETLGPSSRRTGLVFSEIMYRPLPRADGKILQFIELFNSNVFPEDLGGYRIGGEISYTFPSNTVIGARSFLVLAQVPAHVQSVFNLTGVLGYGRTNYVTNLVSGTTSVQTNVVALSGAGRLLLQDREGGVLLEVAYRDEPPWPIAANGGGHSLVLTAPSYGENDPRAWGISDLRGGSPGAAETAGNDGLRPLAINEWLAHANSPLQDYIEIYNHSTRTIDLSGAALTDDPAVAKFIFAGGLRIPARGIAVLTANELGFGLSASGETIYLLNAARTRVIDAVQFEGQAEGISSGRFPDGALEIYPLRSRTPGATNAAPRVADVVINEIMFDPLSGDSDDEFIELYNRGTNLVRLAGWELAGGVTFTFPTNAVIPPGQYLTVARDVVRLFSQDRDCLSCSNLVGNFQGRLSNVGERIALTRREAVNVTNFISVVVDEVTYRRGSPGSARDGSSLELIDARANHRLPGNWAPSDESTKASWSTVRKTIQFSRDYDPAVGLQIIALGAGEFLVDDVVVLGDEPMNLVPNSDFELGTGGWTFAGNHYRSSLATNEGYTGFQSLHVRASGPGDPAANHLSIPLLLPVSGNQSVTVQARVRWLRGHSELVLRLTGSPVEAYGELSLPPRMGTPSLPNSRAVSNAAPVIYEVTQLPVVPNAMTSVVVTARVDDPDGIASLALRYRLDPASTYTSVTMVDAGAAGDLVAGDRLYTAVIPGQTAGTLVAYQIVAVDRANPAATGLYPAGGEALVRFGDPAVTNQMGSYRIWLTRAALTAWTNQAVASQQPVTATFVYGTNRLIHGIEARYAWEAFPRDYDSPLGKPCDYDLSFPGSEPVLGANRMEALVSPAAAPGEDATYQRRLFVDWLARRIGVPWMYQRPVQVFLNGTRRGQFMLDIQSPRESVAAQWFGGDEGELFRLEAWTETQTNTLVHRSWTTLNNHALFGQPESGAFRWNWRPELAETPTRIEDIYSLIRAAEFFSTRGEANELEDIADMGQWMRHFALQHAVGNPDSFGHLRGQHAWVFKPEGDRWRLFTGTYASVLGAAGSAGPTSDDLFAHNPADTNLTAIYGDPEFRRSYLQALKELVDGPLNPAVSSPVLDARHTAFQAAGLTVAPATPIKDWLAARRNYLSAEVTKYNASFAVLGPATIRTNQNWVQITGTAPLQADRIVVNGEPFLVTWLTPTNWVLDFFVYQPTNQLTITAWNRSGQPIAAATAQLTIVYELAIEDPEGRVVVSEIMYNPVAQNTSYLEIQNISPNATFDLSGWELAGHDFAFAPGTILAPGAFLLIVGDRVAFENVYGVNQSIAGEWGRQLTNDADIIKLVVPGATPANDRVIDAVRYEGIGPWPFEANGQGYSLQLIDPQQDNARVANWSIGAPTLDTPGQTNSTQRVLPPFPRLWLNEVQAINRSGPTNRLGQRAPWIELFNSGSTNLVLSNYFLTHDLDHRTQWQFPAGQIIRPGEFLIVWADGQPSLPNELHANFTLNGSNGVVALSRLTNGAPQLLDYVRFTGLAADLSFGAYPDGQPVDREMFLDPTPGVSNQVPARVYINEWMVSNISILEDPADADYEDWIELFNATYHPVDLSGYYLSDTPTNRTQWRFPSGTFIPGRGYLLIWADAEPEQNDPDARDRHANFQLNKTGESIILSRPNGQPLDEIVYTAQLDNLSQGRYPDGTTTLRLMSMPTPRRSNALPPSPQPAAPIRTFGWEPVFLELSVPGVPQTVLSFRIVGTVPPGIQLSPDGTLRWNPVPPSSFQVTIEVCDVRPGSFPFTTTLTFEAELPDAPLEIIGSTRTAGANFQMAWVATPGRSYRIEYRDAVAGTNWVALPGLILCTNSTGSFTTPIGTQPKRFFRVVRP